MQCVAVCCSVLQCVAVEYQSEEGTNRAWYWPCPRTALSQLLRPEKHKPKKIHVVGHVHKQHVYHCPCGCVFSERHGTNGSVFSQCHGTSGSVFQGVIVLICCLLQSVMVLAMCTNGTLTNCYALYTRIKANMNICIYVYMYVCMHVCAYVCVYL